MSLTGAEDTLKDDILYLIDQPRQDVKDSDRDGRLHFLYSLNGVDCPTCATVTVPSWRVIPKVCPLEIQREVAFLSQKPCLTVREFDQIHARWKSVLAKTQPDFIVRPGEQFCDAVWYRTEFGNDDFYWPSYGPVCSNIVRDAFVDACISGVEFSTMSIRLGTKLAYNDNEDDDKDENVLQITCDVANSSVRQRDSPTSHAYSLLITEEDTTHKVLKDFGGVRCGSCGAFRIPDDRRSEYQRAAGISRSKMHICRRWIADSDIFKTAVFGGGLVVRPHVHSLLKELRCSGVRIRALRVTS